MDTPRGITKVDGSPWSLRVDRKEEQIDLRGPPEPPDPLAPLRLVAFLNIARDIFNRIDPKEGAQLGEIVNRAIAPGGEFIDLTSHKMPTQKRVIDAMQLPDLRHALTARAGDWKAAPEYAVSSFDASVPVSWPGKHTPWPGCEELSKWTFHPRKDFQVDVRVRHILDWPPDRQQQAEQVGLALRRGFGAMSHQGKSICFIDLRPCFKALLSCGFGDEDAREMLSKFMGNEDLRRCLFVHGSDSMVRQRNKTWKRVRVLWPVAVVAARGNKAAPVARAALVDRKSEARTVYRKPQPVRDHAEQGFRDAVAKRAIEWRRLDRLTAAKFARQLSDSFVIVEEGPPRIIIADFAKMEHDAYSALAGCELNDLLKSRHRQLGKLSYSVDWANQTKRDRFLPHPWPHGAKFIPFEASEAQRKDMVERVEVFLQLHPSDAEQVASKLLTCIGSVETPAVDTKGHALPPRRLHCVDLRPMPDFLAEKADARFAADVMSQLKVNMPALLHGDPKDDEPPGTRIRKFWSEEFVAVRMIIPPDKLPARASSKAAQPLKGPPAAP